MADYDYGKLQVGEPVAYETTAYRVNGICDGCHTVLAARGLTEQQAAGRLRRHYRIHVKGGHRKAGPAGHDPDSWEYHDDTSGD